MDINIAHELESVARITDTLLWAAHDNATTGTKTPLASRLAFPTCSGIPRVSEQEARFFFAHTLENSKFLYSVETPTQLLYHQSGLVPSRAHFDLTVCDEQNATIAHCEFKCGAISPRRANSMIISKDLEKLVRDPGDGLWFHLLPSTDNSTISNTLSTIARDLWDILNNSQSQVIPKSLIVHLCILKHRFSIHKVLTIDPMVPHLSSLHTELSFVYNVGRSSIRTVQQGKGWNIHTYQQKASFIP